MTPRQPTEEERRRLEEAKRCWDSAPTIDDARRAVERDVVRWEWWTWSVRDVPEPYYAQRNQFPVGRRRTTEPDERGEASRYGFDGQGRIRAACAYDGLGEASRLAVSLYVHPGLRQYYYDEQRNELMSVRLYDLEGGRVTRGVGYSESEGKRWTLHEFGYDDAGLPAWASRWGFEERAGDEYNRLLGAGGVDIFEHDDRGRLQRITQRNQRPGEPEYVLFQRRPKGVSVRQLEQRVLERLTEALPAAAGSGGVEEPVWCLALLYDPGAPLPPSAHLGSERERREWGPVLNPAEWDAAEPPRRLELQDSEAAAACAALSSEWATRDTGPRPARRLLNRLAGNLNELDWTELLPVTEDFFVYAVDLELEELSENLERAVPRSLLRRLRGEGLEG